MSWLPPRGRSVDALKPIVARTEVATAEGVTRAITALISEGTLPPNTLLPTVREVAQALQMSVTTVHKSWRELQAEGLVRTEGRRGSFVRPSSHSRTGGRWRSQPFAEIAAYDLSSGAPNAQLLPSLHLAMFDPDAFRQSSYYGDMVVPSLDTAIREEWGDAFTPEALTVVNGSLDALDRLVRLYVRRGDRVAIEDPTFPPIIRMLECAGAVVIPFGVDDEGPIPSQVAAALHRDPALLVFQPRAQNPTGSALTPERAELIGSILSKGEFPIIEHDSAGSVSSEPLISLADRLPERIIRIHGFSKSHGPDLRLAAIGGSRAVIEDLSARRMLDSAWSSRILQMTLVGLLTNPTARHAVEDARYYYRQRRSALQRALSEHGIHTIGQDGYNLWVPISEASDEPVALAMHGFIVSQGSAFQIADTTPHCRVTVATLPLEVVPHVADLLAGSIPGERLAMVGN